VARGVGAVVLGLVLGALAACTSKNPFGPPPVTTSFVTPDLFYVAMAGDDDAEAPALRQRFYTEAEAFARSSGCTSYRVMAETFLTSANIAPRVSTQPSWVFGRRPVYVGLVECGLPPLPPAAADGGGRS
jgi:hypothetical protein